MKKLRTEKQIIANWKHDIDKPIISISCITFNHESYIEYALKGFLSQETEYPFEVLVHDDASDDNTAGIIARYSKLYPKIIKPMYQTENQYSKKIKIHPTFNFPRAKGDYIALCEGDDYWIMSDKLQKQVDMMRRYPEVNLSFHPAYQVNKNKLNKNKIFSNYGLRTKIFTMENVILGGGGFMPTASLMIKADIVKQLPEWFYSSAPVGDYYLQMIAAIKNGALFIPMIGSIYRQNIEGSWTSQQKQATQQQIRKTAINHEKCFIAINQQYNGIYQDTLYHGLAMILTGCSITALNLNYLALSKEILEKSLLYKSKANRQQSILKVLIDYPKLLRTLIRLKRQIK